MADKPASTLGMQQHPASLENRTIRAFWSSSSSSSSSPGRLPGMRSLLTYDEDISMQPKPQKPCDISNLMSPPEPAHLDTFKPATMASGSSSSSATGARVPRQPLISPPISPFAKPGNTISPESPLNHGAQDPILYPVPESPTNAPAGPLFSLTPESVEAVRAVSEHIASRPADLFRDTSPPRLEDYRLVLYFKSNVMKLFKENPKGWLRKERELLRADRKHKSLQFPPPKLPHILPASRPAVPVRQPAKLPAVRVQKPRAPPKSRAQNPRLLRATPTPARETIQVGTPEPRIRTVAPNREDKDFEALEDLSPPVSSLPASPNSLKVDWKGNALDLSNDPHRHLLHPAELSLASGLRLDCATYLTSKRRIFLRRLECAKIGKEFRKTDAQQACKIDVNKASKLWQAYDSVGWLDIKWMRKCLDRDSHRA